MTCYLFGRHRPVHLFLVLSRLDALSSLRIFESLLEGTDLLLSFLLLKSFLSCGCIGSGVATKANAQTPDDYGKSS